MPAMTFEKILPPARLSPVGETPVEPRRSVVKQMIEHLAGKRTVHVGHREPGNLKPKPINRDEN